VGASTGAVGATSTGATAGLGATGGGALAAGTAGSVSSVGLFSAGAGALATKAAAGLAATLVVTAGAVEVDRVVQHHPTVAAVSHHRTLASIAGVPVAGHPSARATGLPALVPKSDHKAKKSAAAGTDKTKSGSKATLTATQPVKPTTTKTATVQPKHQLGTAATVQRKPTAKPTPPPGRTVTQTTPTTVLPSSGHAGSTGSTGHPRSGTHTTSKHHRPHGPTSATAS
jgi:hypothetical protein